MLKECYSPIERSLKTLARPERELSRSPFSLTLILLALTLSSNLEALPAPVGNSPKARCLLSVSTCGQHQCAELLSFGTVGRHIHRRDGSFPRIRLTKNLFTESSFQFPQSFRPRPNRRRSSFQSTISYRLLNLRPGGAENSHKCMQYRNACAIVEEQRVSAA